MTDPTNRAIPQDGGEEKIRQEWRGRGPIICSQGGFPINGAEIDYWKKRAEKAESSQSTPQAMGGEWRLVPLLADHRMMDAGVEAAEKELPPKWDDSGHPGYCQIRAAYDAMLAAAPSSPAPSSAKVIEATDYGPITRDCYVKIDEQAALIETLKEALRDALAHVSLTQTYVGSRDALAVKIRAALADGGKG